MHHPEACGVGERHVVRNNVDLLQRRCHYHLVGECPYTAYRQDAVADRNLGDVCTDLGNDASGFAAGHERRLEPELIFTAGDQHIGKVQRDSLIGDADLLAAALRAWQLLELQAVFAVQAGRDPGLHRARPVPGADTASIAVSPKTSGQSFVVGAS